MLESPAPKQFKKRQIEKFGQEIEFQEILLDSIAQKSRENFRKLEVPIPQPVFYGLRFIFLIMILALVARIWQLQILEGKKYTALANLNYLATFQVMPERGVIYDKNFTQLVFNKPSFDLMVDKRRLPNEDFKLMPIINLAAELSGKSPQSLLEKIKKSDFAINIVAENLGQDKILLFEQYKKDLLGFYLSQNIVRDYIDGPYFANILGYTGKVNTEDIAALSGYSFSDTIGRIGVERTYEKDLRGTPGLYQAPKDLVGNLGNEVMIRQTQTGNSLVLWLDSQLQKKLTDFLQARLVATGAKKGAAVAIDPRNGAILAMVSLPSFDNNIFSGGISKEKLASLENDSLNPLFNRVIGGQYPTGSVIKPLLSSAALQEGVITEKTKIYAPLELCVKNIYSGEKECYGDWTFHGWTDVKRAIAESINPFFYIIGGGYDKNEYSDPNAPDKFVGLGVSRIKKYLSLFGWGSKLGIDIPGETAGRVPDPDWKKNYFTNTQDQIWRLGDTYNLSIGQGYLLATPLQVAAAYSAIANGGTLYVPRFAQKIVDGQKNTVAEITPQVLRQGFVDQNNLKIAREGMRQAVTSGSATFLSTLPVAVAAKTGTAQISAASDKYYNWITVFAPYDNPQIVLTVMIEDVQGLSAAVLPVAKETLDWYFAPR